MPHQSQEAVTRDAAEALAIRALVFLSQEPERLARFLQITGLEPATLRIAAAEPAFLAGVLDHISADERLLLTFAAHENVHPATVTRAREALADGGQGRPIDATAGPFAAGA